MLQQPCLVPGSEPFFFAGGDTACVLIHGFTAMPEEMLPLGRRLARRAFTVVGVRLAGHATHPDDLARVRWHDWLANVEDALALCGRNARRVVLIGQSMGGMIALSAAARYPIAGVVAISTPHALLRPTTKLPAMVVKASYDPASPLGERREPNYPAYPRFPSRVLRELAALAKDMRASLPAVTAPALVLQSTTDLTPDTLPTFVAALGSSDKHGVWLRGFDHSIVRDRRRATAFRHIETFLDRVAN